MSLNKSMLADSNRQPSVDLGNECASPIHGTPETKYGGKPQEIHRAETSHVVRETLQSASFGQVRKRYFPKDILSVKAAEDVKHKMDGAHMHGEVPTLTESMKANKSKVSVEDSKNVASIALEVQRARRAAIKIAQLSVRLKTLVNYLQNGAAVVQTDVSW
eukprot:SAG11_NODE_2420_length_3380_cov_3.113380_1_plen_160_part_10